jgi:hypothetical protein
MAEIKASAPGTPSESVPDRRRTQRVQIAMPVLVRGTHGSHKFEEEALTVSINANGCMLRLAAQVARTQQLSIINPKTAEELPCVVTFLGQKDSGKTEVGIEFSEASPLFWRIAFPPEDWDPSERKRASAPRPPAAKPHK